MMRKENLRCLNCQRSFPFSSIPVSSASRFFSLRCMSSDANVSSFTGELYSSFHALHSPVLIAWAFISAYSPGQWFTNLCLVMIFLRP